MKIIFMGTPDFAVPALNKLIESNNDVLAVFTQPDKPVGRKQILTPPPVKTVALKNNITVYQPETFRDGKAIELIKKLSPDLIVVVAYGKILPKEVIDFPKYFCVNIHASLLPKYRGAAPIQHAVLNGDKETGVSFMKMDEGLDTGDILRVVKTDIGDNETSLELFERLSCLGADSLLQVIDDLKSNKIQPIKQDDGISSYAQKITKDLSPIDWSKPACEIHNQVRGLFNWPCAATRLNGKTLKILKTNLSDKQGYKIGAVVDNNNVITVCCGDGRCIDITELQLEGKKKMDSKSFLQGNKIEIATVLGE